MSKKNIINEFQLTYIRGAYHLKSKELFNKEFQDVSHQEIWNFLTNKYTIKDFANQCVWIFFITQNQEIKGFYQMNFQEFHSQTATEVLRLILMLDVKNVIFALNYSQKVNLFDIPPRVVRFYKKKLLPFEINVIDALVVSKHKYDSLVMNALL
jgi:hypothetical protein